MRDFVSRLDFDLEKETKLMEPSLTRVASLAPVLPKEIEKVKLKTKDGKIYEIPLLQSNIN